METTLSPELSEALEIGRLLLIDEEASRAKAIQEESEAYAAEVKRIVAQAKGYLPAYLQDACVLVNKSLAEPLDKYGGVKPANFGECIDFEVVLPFGDFRFCLNQEFTMRGPICLHMARIEPNGSFNEWYEPIDKDGAGGWDKPIEVILAMVERQAQANAKLRAQAAQIAQQTRPVRPDPKPQKEKWSPQSGAQKPSPAKAPVKTQAQAQPQKGKNDFVLDDANWNRLVEFAISKGWITADTTDTREFLCQVLLMLNVPHVSAHNFTACKRMLEGHFSKVVVKEDDDF